ncbi:ribonucleotide reductase assembly protein NrdI [Brachybacterium sp. P6-10-X1]|uniref:class Ib ribonucleoside-diphosphate reductase assembly flavoprotein NrdI n=1 Tax=Brachybacterium sp. P6-10-X1 TaxID=1903186 RepID=UPI000971AEE2|nr:class Ib ribonucleoside-diphosphate reductase assembly flavoprotein NrdI [Brachybacterium sp. P6-10-X1]APX34586.1 ribonucleotide reductase assembly protein NrdI [Brachybacterium sp. P6-10-X1]
MSAVSETHTWSDLVFFSSVSETTRRFVDKLGLSAARIPLRRGDHALVARRPFVLITPTYGGGNGRGAVPKQVIAFLNEPRSRGLIRGVIGAGNTNFGEAYCLAGDVIADKCQVPLLYRVELLGTPRDVEAVRDGLARFLTEHHQHPVTDESEGDAS